MEEPFPDDLTVLAPTERELFSLYAQHPEINFDPKSTQKMAESSAHFSSPASNTGHGDELASVEASNSTRHTTPLKHDIYNTGVSDEDDYTAFCTLLEDCDLPPQTLQYLKSIGSRFAHLGRCLIAEHDVQPGLVTGITSSLLPQLQHSAYKIKEQMDTVEFVANLASFNIFPTDVSLWSNYRQRATLISKSVAFSTAKHLPLANKRHRHLSCPSRTELKLLDQLVHVFDAYAYHPYLHLKLQDGAILTEIGDAVNALYDALMMVLAMYQKWLRTMRGFKAKYMLPIMRRIQASPWIQREIEQMDMTAEAAQEALSKNKDGVGNVASLALQDDQVRAATRVAERRATSSASKVPARTKTRLKREHTV